MNDTRMAAERARPASRSRPARSRHSDRTAGLSASVRPPRTTTGAPEPNDRCPSSAPARGRWAAGMNQGLIRASRAARSSADTPSASRSSSVMTSVSSRKASACRASSARIRSKATRSSADRATSTRRRYANSALDSRATFSAQYLWKVW